MIDVGCFVIGIDSEWFVSITPMNFSWKGCDDRHGQIRRRRRMVSGGHLRCGVATPEGCSLTSYPLATAESRLIWLETFNSRPSMQDAIASPTSPARPAKTCKDLQDSGNAWRPSASNHLPKGANGLKSRKCSRLQISQG